MICLCVPRRQVGFHTFTGPAPDVNFDNGDIADWIFTGGPLGGSANIAAAKFRSQQPG